MKLAIVQTNPVFGASAANVRDALAMMESARADLYVLPELFNTGYNFTSPEEAAKLAEPADGPTFTAVAAFAKKHKACVVYGFAERATGLFNSSALIGPEGLIGLYRKVHLYYREKLFFQPGDLGFPVFDLPSGRVGMMICFDWIFPESARALALNGAQLIAHPSNLVMPHCPDAMVTRCLENRVFTATANRVGSENRGGVDLSFIGRSEIVTPRGEILFRFGPGETGVHTAEIDLRAAAQKRINEHNDLFADRRPSLYI